MKKLFAAVIAVSILLSGCVSVNFGSYGGNTIRGSGEFISRSFDTETFSALTLGGAFELFYESSDECSLRVEMEENLFDYIEVRNNNGELYIETTANLVLRDGGAPQLFISAPALQAVSVLGAVNFKNSDVLRSKKLRLDIRGAGSLSAELDVTELDVLIAGAGAVVLSGKATNATVLLSGAGALDAYGLQTVNADINLSGAGGVEIYCSERLDATISGVGGISYRGDPVVEKHVSGIGAVVKNG